MYVLFTSPQYNYHIFTYVVWMQLNVCMYICTYVHTYTYIYIYICNELPHEVAYLMPDLNA